MYCIVLLDVLWTETGLLNNFVSAECYYDLLGKRKNWHDNERYVIVPDVLEGGRHCDNAVAYIHCRVLSFTWESVTKFKAMNYGCKSEYGLMVSRVAT
jgi:hypothetical protein